MQRRALLAAVAWFTACAAVAQPRLPDVIFVPTPQEVVEDMLRLAELRAGDVLYDLGSGDGRIPITAALRAGIRAVGIDIDPYRVDEARENARRAGVGGQVDFRLGDVLTADFREATVVTLFLLPELNAKLRPRLLRELRPGTRIVSHQFDLGDWRPDRQRVSNGRTLYFWTVPPRHTD